MLSSSSRDPQGSASDSYLRTQVLTAGPERLQLMLYDGALRWCGRARVAIAAGDREAALLALERARLVMLYLAEGLRPVVAPQLCALVAGAYQFIFGRLVEAGLHQRLDALDEAVGALAELRAAWADLLAGLKRHPGAPPLDSPADPLRLTA
jgi:flagellar protein FliS